jgi:glycosyltransferase involved in cell wall biosynthesis
MKFTIITHAEHKIHKQEIFAYEPYVKEMNLWLKFVDEVKIVAPVSEGEITAIEIKYQQNNKNLHQVCDDESNRHCEQSEAISSNKQITSSPTPRNDENECHPEPVEGYFDLGNDDEMLNQVQYDESEHHSVTERSRSAKDEQITSSNTPRNDGEERHPQLDWGSYNSKLKFIFVGGLTPGKQPLLSVQVIHKLKEQGYQVHLDMYGDGVEREKLAKYIADNALEENIKLHGNTAKEIVKAAYQQAHFLLFISKSEGWPKVVAEAMFWGCVPITSKVSCVPYMLDNGNRGAIVNSDINEIFTVIADYLTHPKKYLEQSQNAKQWSRTYTLEKFEEEIGKLLNDTTSKTSSPA